MQISLEWIKELVDIETIQLENLIDKLTLGGFEVEEILEIELQNKKTIALDISATANRSDSLSIQGLSLELSALLNNVPKESRYSIKNSSWSKQIQDSIKTSLNHDSCLGFIAITINNLNNFNSPKWLQQKLIASGITPENNLIDFQNYIILETGYPLEVYDLKKIESMLKTSDFQFHLNVSDTIEIFEAGNDSEYKLDNSTLLLKANDLPISIAGIINSKESAVSQVTNSLLVEASIFNAASIRQQSRKLGLRTERSSRYEKALKNIDLLDALYRLISLLRISNPELNCKLHTISQPKEELPKVIELDYQRVNQVLGPLTKVSRNNYSYLSPEIITDCLERLRFKLDYDQINQKWKVTVPLLRTDDIVLEIDLIEEIGRIHGFNNFLTRLPTIQKVGTEDFDYKVRKKLTSCFINMGLNELIQYSLVSDETYVKNEIPLVNPLVKDYSNLRSSLLPNLIKTVEENLKKGNHGLEGFEYGHVFSKGDSSTVEEIEYVAGVFGGMELKSSWSSSKSLLDWFEAKGKIEQLFQKLNIVVYWKFYNPVNEKSLLHPYRSAELITTSGQKIGIFSQVSSILAKKLNLSPDTYLFEFNFETIKKEIQNNKLVVYQEYSSYPKIIKDLSFIISDTLSFDTIERLLYINGSQFLKEVNLLDEYKGKSIPKDHTSLCLQFVFQSESRTLETQKVEQILGNLKDVLINNFNATIRT